MIDFYSQYEPEIFLKIKKHDEEYNLYISDGDMTTSIDEFLKNKGFATGERYYLFAGESIYPEERMRDLKGTLFSFDEKEKLLYYRQYVKCHIYHNNKKVATVDVEDVDHISKIVDKAGLEYSNYNVVSILSNNQYYSIDMEDPIYKYNPNLEESIVVHIREDELGDS